MVSALKLEFGRMDSGGSIIFPGLYPKAALGMEWRLRVLVVERDFMAFVIAARYQSEGGQLWVTDAWLLSLKRCIIELRAECGPL